MAGRTLDVAGREQAAKKTRKAAVYLFLRRMHLAIALVIALPLTVTSLTGALLVFGHELDQLIRPLPTVTAREAPTLPFSELFARVKAQRPDVSVWALAPKPERETPWRVWLKGGKGIFEIDPWTGDILDAYRPAETPYNIVRALHRRWLVNGKPESDWTRTAISVTALALMVQVLFGIWMWALPGKPFRRLKPAFGRGKRLRWQRLHMASGVVTALILLAVAFTGLSMYWADSTRAIVEFVLPGDVVRPAVPRVKDLAPVRDLDEAVAVAHRLIPEARIASVRPPEKFGAPVHVGLETAGSRVNSRVWVGDAPPRVLAFHDGREASAATRFWHFRYWFHIGDFAGLPIRILWIFVSLMPVAFVASGLWLWRDRRPSRRERLTNRQPLS